MSCTSNQNPPLGIRPEAVIVQTGELALAEGVPVQGTIDVIEPDFGRRRQVIYGHTGNVNFCVVAPLDLHLVQGYPIKVIFPFDALYFFDTETEEEIMENWLDVAYQFGGFRTGIMLKSSAPSEEGERANAIEHRFFEYAAGDVRVRAGHFFGIFGRGLIFNAYEDRTVRVDSRLDGLTAGTYFLGTTGFEQHVDVIFGGGSIVTNYFAIDPNEGAIYVAATDEDEADGTKVLEVVRPRKIMKSTKFSRSTSSTFFSCRIKLQFNFIGPGIWISGIGDLGNPGPKGFSRPGIE